VDRLFGQSRLIRQRTFRAFAAPHVAFTPSLPLVRTTIGKRSENTGQPRTDQIDTRSPSSAGDCHPKFEDKLTTIARRAREQTLLPPFPLRGQS
jgi:hypothetical protein